MRKNKFGIIILILLIILIIAGGSFAYAYFFTDIFRSNKELFMKYISQNSEVVNTIKQNEIEAYMEKQKNTPYMVKGVLKANSTNSNITELAKNASINISGTTDRANNYNYRNIKLNNLDENVITLDYINIQDYYGLRVPEVASKYLVIENNNLKQFCEKMGMSSELVASIPNKIELKRYDYTNIFTEEEKNTIISKYKKILIDNLKDDMFTKNETADEKIYILTIKRDDALQIAKEFLTQLKEDELIFEKLKRIMVNDFNMTDADAMKSISDAKKQIQQYLNEIQNKDISIPAYETNSIVGNEEQKENTLIIKTYVNDKKLTKTEILIDEKSSISLSISGNSIDMNYIDSEIDNYALNIKKVSLADSTEYSISVNKGNANLSNIVISFSGLNTLETVQEQWKWNFIDSNGSNSGFVYNETKQFNNNITKQNITNNDMLLINDAPSKEKLLDILSLYWQKMVTIINSKVANNGITDNSLINRAQNMIN